MTREDEFKSTFERHFRSSGGGPLTTRRNITLPEMGARLLDKASGQERSKQRRAGDYLAAVLQQRRNAWTEALAHLLRAGKERSELRAMLDAQCGRIPTLEDLNNAAELARLRAGTGGIAFCLLLQEYNAGNQELRKALEGDEHA